MEEYGKAKAQHERLTGEGGMTACGRMSCSSSARQTCAS